MKKIKYLLIVFICFMLVGGVDADNCTDCANKGTPCGYCGYSCAEENGVCVTKNANNYTCKYKTSDGKQWVNFNVKNGKVTRDDVSSGGSKLKGGKEEIRNWTKEYGGFSAKDYVLDRKCPPFVLAFNKNVSTNWFYYVSNGEKKSKIKETFQKENGSFLWLEIKGYDKFYELYLVDGPGFKYALDHAVTLRFHVNN